MFKVKVNNTSDFEVRKEGTAFFVNERLLQPDIQRLGERQWHIILEGRSYPVELVDKDPKNKTIVVRINHSTYHLEIKDRYDELLERLGMNELNLSKVGELKAPMPGMVLKILVEEGQRVSKGDGILILEAMKMENIIKAPADAVIKSIYVKTSAKVEKNELMIVFQ